MQKIAIDVRQNGGGDFNVGRKYLVDELARRPKLRAYDEGNLDKNWEKHGVPFWECEEVFLNRPLMVRPDDERSKSERRYYALGRTEAGRLLFVAFTIRRTLIRPISARDMTMKERRAYEFYSKKDSEVQ